MKETNKQKIPQEIKQLEHKGFDICQDGIQLLFKGNMNEHPSRNERNT